VYRRAFSKKIYGNRASNVNSVHHQGVKTLGKNLIVDAICPVDQTIESFHYQHVLGVQWHPEFSHTLGSTVIDPEPLFDYFLEQIKK